MPQVPTYQQGQVRENALQFPNAPQQTIQAPKGGVDYMVLGEGLMSTGEAEMRAAYRMRQANADVVESAITSEWLKWDSQARQKYRGVKAAEYETAAAEWWAKAGEDYGKNLDPEVRSMASKGLFKKQQQAMANVMSFVVQEQERHADEAAEANIASTIQFGVTTGDIKSTADQVRTQVSQIGARKGWTTEQVQQAELKALGGMHTTVINKMLANDNVGGASKYYEQNKAEIPFNMQDNMEATLKTAKKAAAAAANPAFKTDVKTHAALWDMMVNDPAKFKDVPLLTYRDRLSQSDWEQLMTKQQTLKQGGGHAYRLESVSKTVDSTLKQMKIDPDKDPATYVKVQREVENRLNYLSGGKEMTPEMEKKVIDSVALDLVSTPGVFGASQKPAILLSPKEQEKGFVTVTFKNAAGKNVTADARLTAIPVAERVKIEDTLRRNREPITQQKVMQMYILGNPNFAKQLETLAND